MYCSTPSKASYETVLREAQYGQSYLLNLDFYAGHPGNHYPHLGMSEPLRPLPDLRKTPL